MLSQLTEAQIDNLLLSQAIGRIGCINGSRPYIIPVTYVYDGHFIYGQTHEGLKLDLLRKNPAVCFQVDVIVNMTNWQSVLVTGSFEELHGEESMTARRYLGGRVYPLKTNSTVHTHEHEVTTGVDDSNRLKPVMYKIIIAEKTGRFEKQ